MRRRLLVELIEETPSFIGDIQKAINDINLFNLKLIYINKIFSLGCYNEEMREYICRELDLAQTKEEAKLIYYRYRTEFYMHVNEN